MTPCPEENLISAYLQGEIPPAERDAVAEHLASCGECLAIVEAALAGEEDPSAGETGPADPRAFLDGMEARAREELAAARRGGSRFRRPGQWAAAAGVIVSLSAGAGWMLLGPAAGRVPPATFSRDGSTLSPGTEIRARAEERLSLSDGSAIAISPGGALRIEVPGDGDRASVVLTSGRADFTIAKAAGGFRIGTAQGEIRVLGTSFRVTCGDPASGLPECTELLVREGSVHVRTARAQGTVVRGGQCAYLFGDGDLWTYADAPSTEESARRYVSTLADELLAPGTAPLSKGAATTVFWLRRSPHASLAIEALPAQTAERLRNRVFGE